jgi:hypothetical protein
MSLLAVRSLRRPLMTPSARTYRFNSKKRRLSAPRLREQCRFWVNVTPLRPAIYIPSHL